MVGLLSLKKWQQSEWLRWGVSILTLTVKHASIWEESCTVFLGYWLHCDVRCLSSISQSACVWRRKSSCEIKNMLELPLRKERNLLTMLKYLLSYQRNQVISKKKKKKTLLGICCVCLYIYIYIYNNQDSHWAVYIQSDHLN